MDNDDFMVTLGSSLKALSGGVIEGHLILFGDESRKDLQGQFFTPNTYLGKGMGTGRDVTFNHRKALPIPPELLDGVADKQSFLKSYRALHKRVMINPLETEADALGVLGRVALDLSNMYEAKIYELAQKGVLKWSAGASPHMIDANRKTGEIETFVITEGALTPVPAEFRMLEHRVFPMKSLIGALTENARLPLQEGKHKASRDGIVNTLTQSIVQRSIK